MGYWGRGKKKRNFSVKFTDIFSVLTVTTLKTKKRKLTVFAWEKTKTKRLLVETPEIV